MKIDITQIELAMIIDEIGRKLEEYENFHDVEDEYLVKLDKVRNTLIKTYESNIKE
jgi:hypothetical protein